MNSRTVETIVPSPQMHWVGDGFPVSSVISPGTVGNRLSPYILMDYAGPAHFGPSDQPRGVDTHPHRGFETVTVVYDGELEHRDSAGNSGRISSGDVQWMTAASGILHEEKHSRKFTEDGGTLEMAQLWVNLPTKYKMSKPRYQTILRDAISTVNLPGDAGTMRIIAGKFESTTAAAKTFSPVILWDVQLRAGRKAELPVPAAYNVGVFVRSGSLRIGGGDAFQVRQLAILENNGDGIAIAADRDSRMIILGGEPINEPVVAHGPFVMNTKQEIETALDDYRQGRFGSLK